MKNFKPAISLLILAFVAQPSRACDLYPVYIQSSLRGEETGSVTGGISEQFTHFGAIQRDGEKVPNPTGQYLESSITQILLSYRATDRFSLQLNVPYIYRVYRRPENFNFDTGVDANGDGSTDVLSGTNIAHGREQGLGDVSLVGNFNLWRKESEDFTFSWNILGGLKFPSGNTARLSEELREVDVDGAPESGVHGHDLNLGTGSFDGIVGTSVFTRWKRLLFDASFQYAARGEGDYSYRFADDMTWKGGPGAYLFLENEFTLAVQAHVSGESKGRDSSRGVRTNDSGVTAVYLGPRLTGTWSDRLSADIGADFPVSIQNTAFQSAPDYRIHFSVNWHF